eukprot:CAMPEP_0171334390 /NCGR_PEP_ID=MMETSP0878-20121228/4619_1 /TAXON_ID=67004 /ORGANISM="Thalassiosira weissflogii, Strain CCMP1336" /LENGTH=479 /DNA_ID=CAMNT_0011835463 /DNA_START=156 /DNA_END=1594 /DNA_ORIENTATION=-
MEDNAVPPPPIPGDQGGPHVDMYLVTPSFELSLDEFEEYALARLKVLRIIEEMKTRNVPPENFRSALETSIKNNLTSAKSAEESKKIDVASHFILRAAYCRTEDLRRWFIAQEGRLFRHRLEGIVRFNSGNVSLLRDFLERNEFDLDRVTRDEKERLRQNLQSIPGSPNPMEFNVTEYCKVPFVQALELVKKRECYVEKGFAYVPLPNIVSIVCEKFRASLSKSLALASQVFGQVAEEENSRIGPLLKSMNSQYTGSGAPSAITDANGENLVTAATVDALAAQSMPLCMQQLHSGLKRDHKLKHQGRLQFGLFLKGAGMTMDEHLLFFQREFTRIMTAEQFTKQYSYSIRHMHGKEGKRASYTPYTCTKIIFGNAPQAAVEHHGCPYKHYDDQNLSALLTKLNIGTISERDAILSLKKDGHFQLACQKHFEVKHPDAKHAEGVKLDDVGNHPNSWFSASVSYHNSKAGVSSAVEGEKEL